MCVELEVKRQVNHYVETDLRLLLINIKEETQNLVTEAKVDKKKALIFLSMPFLLRFT